MIRGKKQHFFGNNMMIKHYFVDNGGAPVFGLKVKRKKGGFGIQSEPNECSVE